MANELLHNRVSRKKVVPHKQSDVFKKMFDNAPPTVEVTEAKVILRMHLDRITCPHGSMEKHLEKYVALVRELWGGRCMYC